MKKDVSDIKLEKNEKFEKRTSKLTIVLVVVYALFSVYLFNGYANASLLTQKEYSSIKSGEIFYKANDGKLKKALSLDTKVSMKITGIVNRVQVIQTFKNQDDYWTEGIYLFPLPDDAAVDNMFLRIGETIIIGEIQKKEMAKKIYEQAKSEGKNASLVEQVRPNLFTTKVANIPPKGEITVVIEYQQKVYYDNEEFKITFPMVSAQRYLPTNKNSSLKNSSDINLIQKTENKNNPINRPVNIDIELSTGFDTKEITSTNHKIVTTKKDDNYFIKLANTVQADGDFQLKWKANKTNEVQAKLFTKTKDNFEFGLLMLTPPNEIYLDNSYESTKREVIFIVDSSGSMSGTSIKQAKKALELAIDRLNPEDRFNIIDYDDSYNTLFNSAQRSAKLTKLLARDFISKIYADGGTKAFEPIKYAFNSTDNKSKEYLRQIVFITDGLISNENKIFKIIKEKNDISKFFTVSIGSAPNSFFMKKAANYGKGTFASISNETEVAKKMSEFFRKLENPALTDIKINGLDVNISDLYFGETVYYSFQEKTIPNSLKLEAKINGKIYTKEINKIKKEKSSGIDVLWARNTIDDLMKLYYLEYDKSKLSTIENFVTKIALSFNLVSDFTSLVAVDKTPVKAKNEILKSKQVETKIPNGWKLYDANVPQTSTNSNLFILFGLLIIFVVLLYKRGRNNEQV